MLPQSGSGDPTDAEREVKRKFQFSQTGGTGFTADVRFPYLAAELNTNTETNLVSWVRFSGEWNGKLASTRDVVQDWVATTAISQSDLINEWKLADPRYTFNVTANLAGGWNGINMNTTLNSTNTIPLAQPFNSLYGYAGTESVGSIPNANIIDWVLIEHRKPITGLPADALSATRTGRRAGFLLNTGVVVDIDGVTPINFDITKQGTAFITVRHRNHLGVLSNAIASNAAGTFANDYSILANSYKAIGAASDPVQLLPGGIKYGMWAGDANNSGNINGTDISLIKTDISALASGYLLTDINLSKTINGTDVTIAKATISSLGTGSNPARNANTSVKTNIPDPISE